MGTPWEANGTMLGTVVGEFAVVPMGAWECSIIVGMIVGFVDAGMQKSHTVM